MSLAFWQVTILILVYSLQTLADYKEFNDDPLDEDYFDQQVEA